MLFMYGPVYDIYVRGPTHDFQPLTELTTPNQTYYIGFKKNVHQIILIAKNKCQYIFSSIFHLILSNMYATYTYVCTIIPEVKIDLCFFLVLIS